MKILTAMIVAAFMLTGCEYVQPYTDKAKENLKPLTDSIGDLKESIQPYLDKLPEIKPTDLDGFGDKDNN